jgi:hypothetical protein
MASHHAADSRRTLSAAAAGSRRSAGSAIEAHALPAGAQAPGRPRGQQPHQRRPASPLPRPPGPGLVAANMMKRLSRVRVKPCSPTAAHSSRSSTSSHQRYAPGLCCSCGRGGGAGRAGRAGWCERGPSAALHAGSGPRQQLVALRVPPPCSSPAHLVQRPDQVVVAQQLAQGCARHHEGGGDKDAARLEHLQRRPKSRQLTPWRGAGAVPASC